jgi:hypothetical protein
MLLCKFCDKECKSPNSHRNHERTCPKNPNRQITFGMLGKTGGTPWNKGQTKETNESVKQGAEKFRQRIDEGSYIPHKTHHTDEMKSYLAEKMYERYESGWEPTCGRCKKYDYESPVAGKIKVDGTWELKVAKHLDALGIVWQRNKKRFPYVRPDGKQATYQPDFYVDEWNSFIEVKGYETDLDKAKWSQFPGKLIIWKKDFIQTLED